MRIGNSALIAIVMAAMVIGGCEGARTTTPGAEKFFQHAQTLDVSAREYRVNPPDQLTLQCSAIKELDKAQVVIRPDGKISLNLLGEVYVAGKTPEEISRMLTEQADKYYNKPDIRVEVTGYNSKFYFFFGEVGNGGKKPFTGRDTVVSAMADAGFTQDSWPQQVYVNRQIGPKPDDAVTVVVNMKHMYMTGDVTQNYLLKENDIVSVAVSPLAQWRKNTENIAGPLGSGAGTIQTVAPTRTGGGSK